MQSLPFSLSFHNQSFLPILHPKPQIIKNPIKTLSKKPTFFMDYDPTDHFRNTHMIQLPNHRRYTQPWSPGFVSDADGPFLAAADGGAICPTTYPPTIDVDRSLTDAFSMLHLSPATYSDPPPAFHHYTLAGQVGPSIVAGESSSHSFNSLHLMHNDLGVNNFFNRRWSDDVEALRRHSSSGFDFDQESNLDQNPCSLSQCQNQYEYQYQNPSQSQSQHFQAMNVWGLRDRIYTMAKHQNGCRILQQMLERPTIDEVEIVLSEVVDYVSDLMQDQFGNYLVQKVVSLCNDDQKMRLIQSLTRDPSDTILVCINPHGTRAMQKLLENLNPGQIKLVMNAIYHSVAKLATDPNGHHVIQYCLVNFPSDINKPILTVIANECYSIATDRSGCCVLQACVEHSNGELRRRILTEIMANAVRLAEDPFGNYVLQHILGLDRPELTALLVRQLQGNFASLSCNKYASNVVEKCLNESDEEMSTRIVMELVRSPNSSSLLVDPYANFVIQCALKVSKGFAHDCLCSIISKNMFSMRTNLYGKKILERFEKKRVNLA